MNAITSDFIWCAYRDLTLSGKALRVPFHDLDGALYRSFVDRAISKYQQRGFEFFSNINELEQMPHDCGVHPLCPQTFRTLLDGHTLFFAFGSDVSAKTQGDEKYKRLTEYVLSL